MKNIRVNMYDEWYPVMTLQVAHGDDTVDVVLTDQEWEEYRADVGKLYAWEEKIEARMVKKD